MSLLAREPGAGAEAAVPALLVARDAYLAAAAAERHAADAANAAATVRRSRGSLAAACSRLHRSVHCRPPYEVARGESVSKC